jgi:SAM-dependent methyltransferase
LCGADDPEPWHEKDGMRIVRCRQCGLIYVNPRMNDPNPENIYNAEYFEYYLLTEWSNRKTFDRRLRKLDRLRPQKGLLLDVGCSIGDFIEVAQEHGWEAHGLDITADFKDQIRERTGVEIMVGDFLQVPIEPNTYDLVNMGDSIEHMLDPQGAVHKVRDILKPGGIGYIRAPDCRHIAPRLFKGGWIQIKPKEHLYYFHRGTMRRMIEQAGLEVLSIGSSGAYYTLDIILNRVRHYFGNARAAARFFDFFANTLKLGRIRFPLDVLEELQVIFRKPE